MLLKELYQQVTIVLDLWPERAVEICRGPDEWTNGVMFPWAALGNSCIEVPHHEGGVGGGDLGKGRG